MQDCYAGDIGDYGKFALLRELCKQGLSIGVNWYKTDAIASGKQIDGNSAFRIASWFMIQIFLCV